MNKISFLPIVPEDHSFVQKMILDFYGVTDGVSEKGQMTAATVATTIARTVSHPDQLQIIVFKNQEEIIGYALLSSFWSNEYGGLVSIVDELYTVTAYRSKGIASQFIEQLDPSEKYVRIQLEVFPENVRAFELYKRLNFKIIDRIFMTKERD